LAGRKRTALEHRQRHGVGVDDDAGEQRQASQGHEQDDEIAQDLIHDGPSA
jgi:hypothetical protein